MIRIENTDWYKDGWNLTQTSKETMTHVLLIPPVPVHHQLCFSSWIWVFYGFWSLEVSFLSFCLSYASWYCYYFSKTLFFRAALSLQQNWDGGTEISCIPPFPQTCTASPLSTSFTRMIHFLPRMNLRWHTVITQSS